jgi:hypothetical protein
MYTFNSNLRVGDIILVRGAAKHSKMIAKLTDGHFSHAMIALENEIFLEAITGSGVQTTSMLRVSFKDKANVIVLRCIFPDEKTETNALRYITQNYAAYQGRKYSFKGAAESIKKNGDDSTKGGYFCSHLVASIYTDAGFPLLDKPTHKVTPNDLVITDVLEDITDHVISCYSDITLQRVKEKGKTINCIDAGGDTLSKDAKNHRELLKQTAKYFTRNNLKSPNRCGEFLDILTDPQNTHIAKDLDYQISKKYKKIGINEYLKSQMEGTDFESDRLTVISEIEQFGYDHAHNIYSSYNYLLITSFVKLLNAKFHLEHFQLFYDKWKFKYFFQKIEYHNLTAQSLSGIMEHYIDAIKYIEDKFPDCRDDLQETKKAIMVFVIDKQVDPNKKEEIVNFFKGLA